MKRYETLIQNYADQKIKCFTEEVIKVKKLDIEFICTDQGANQSIKEALAEALGDQITCQHVGCQKIQEHLDSQMEGMKAINVHLDWNQDITVEKDTPGVPDFDGNVTSPAEGASYMLVVKGENEAFANQFSLVKDDEKRTFC